MDKLFYTHTPGRACFPNQTNRTTSPISSSQHSQWSWMTGIIWQNTWRGPESKRLTEVEEHLYLLSSCRANPFLYVTHRVLLLFLSLLAKDTLLLRLLWQLQ